MFNDTASDKKAIERTCTWNVNTDQLADQFQTALYFQRDYKLREQTQLHLMGLRGSNAPQLSQ